MRGDGEKSAASRHNRTANGMIRGVLSVRVLHQSLQVTRRKRTDEDLAGWESTCQGSLDLA